MRNIFITIILILILSENSAAETTCTIMKNKWKGIVRFNPADNFINLHNALPGVDVTWTRYFFPSLGGSIEININFGWGVLPAAEISLLSGVEYIPIGPVNKEKNGLFLDAKIGFSVFILNEIKFFFIAKTNAGYQLITGKGFVFTPGIGVIYNSRNGFGLNLMFDIGFAYKYKKIKT